MSGFKKGLFVGIVIMSSIFLFIASTKSEVETNDRREIAEFYLIRETNLENFNVSMNKYIGLGWKPYGSPIVTNNSHWFFQTIVKYKED